MQSPTQSHFSSFALGPTGPQGQLESPGTPHGFQGTLWKIDNYNQVFTTLFFFSSAILRLAGPNFYFISQAPWISSV